jgi:hypothetical protein
MGLQIIGAGLGRTGTMSLKLALQDLLGGRCYHMDEVQQRAGDPDVWGEASAGNLPDWNRFFDGYVAAVDWPAAPFWRELSDAFPDAPILLSVRDVDAWWKSASRTIFIALATYFSPTAEDNGWTRMGRGMMEQFSPEWFDEASAKTAYLAYNEHVRATAPPGRLFEWTAGEGWGPLCAALGVDVPDHPFPHVNKEADTRASLGLDP